MALSHLDTISIPVTDQHKSLHFYQQCLGFDLVRDHASSLNKRWVQLVPKGAKTSISLVKPFGAMKAGSVQGLVVKTDDLSATYEELVEKGVNLTAIIELPTGRFTTFVDPDGNGWIILELKTSLLA